MSSTLLPCATEVELDHLVSNQNRVEAVLRCSRIHAVCPQCQASSGHIHSRYIRTLADLPWNGVAVRIKLHTRRFFCQVLGCSQRIFAERLPGTVVHYGRRTIRLAHALQLLGLAMGGEAGARVARQLSMTTSPDTLLRRIRQAGVAVPSTTRILGVDDWAWRKGMRYGTILVDLERHRVIDLLPDRQANTFADWLRAHPKVEVISRDRAGAYADGARQGAPQACQVADRWHLLANLGECIRELLERHRPLLKQAIQRQTPASDLAMESVPQLAFERRRQQLAEQSRTGRLARYQQVRQLHQQGVSERAISRQLRMSRKVVRRFLANNQFPERAARQLGPTPLTPYHDYLQRRWAEGCHNSAQLWREIGTQGYRGKRSSVRDFVAPWRSTSSPPIKERTDRLSHAPSPRFAALLVLQPSEKLTEEQQSFVKRLVEHEEVSTAIELGRQFVRMIRERRHSELDAWIEDAEKSQAPELRRFANGLKRDYAAVSAALREPWSNGQVEGQVHRLKLIKRQMYGRGKLDLLRQRMLHAA